MTREVQITSSMEAGFITIHDPEGNELCLD